MYLERELDAARHVEVQLLADRHGNVIHLGERDCSAQRRHQKIVEEAPSPAVDADLRAELGAAAVAIAYAAGYESAGTAEFLLLADGSWYFLELNARLQVEHPVTELVTGIDLVRAQLAIATGERLEWAQSDISPIGHAIECRIYAEDPAAGFVPATGTLLRFEIPAWPGVRLDSGVQAGDEIGLHHDPMLAKVIAHAEDRDACIERMTAVLREIGRARGGDEPRVPAVAPEPPPVVGAARSIPASSSAPGALSWCHHSPPTSPVRPRLRCSPPGRGATTATPATVPVISAGGFVQHDGWQYPLDDDHEPTAAAAASGSLQAPMPGTVLRVAVAAGDTVRAGQELIVIEAMKMELAVTAPRDGRVHTVSTTVGAQVARNQTLVGMDD